MIAFFYNKKGLTLMEVLVVIAVVAVLATASVIILSDFRAKSRDTNRIAAVKQIKDALGLYYLHNGIYLTEIVAGQTLAVGNTAYLSPVPTNPTPQTDGDCASQNFVYTVDADNQDYELKFCLGAATSTYASGVNICLSGGTCYSSQPETFSGLIFWLKADSLDLNDSEKVAIWYDSSSAGNDATAATVSKQPIFKTNILNGQPIVRFDGVDDVLNLDSDIMTLRTAMILLKWDTPAYNYVPILGHTTYYAFHGDTGASNDIVGLSSPATLRNGGGWIDGTATMPINMKKIELVFS